MAILAKRGVRRVNCGKRGVFRRNIDSAISQPFVDRFG